MSFMINPFRKTVIAISLCVGTACACIAWQAIAKEPTMNDRQLQQLRSDVDGLLDREAIRQLPIVYCHYVRNKDIKGIVSLFTPDGEVILSSNIGQGAGAKGAEALTSFYEKSIAGADPWPFTHNHYIEMLGPDRAKGFVYVELRYGSQNYRTATIGVYEDEYEKKDGAWKFRSRKYDGVQVPPGS